MSVGDFRLDCRESHPCESATTACERACEVDAPYTVEQFTIVGIAHRHVTPTKEVFYFTATESQPVCRCAEHLLHLSPGLSGQL